MLILSYTPVPCDCILVEHSLNLLNARNCHTNVTCFSRNLNELPIFTDSSDKCANFALSRETHCMQY